MAAPRRPARLARLAIHPLTPGRWPDLVRLFGPRGACAGCWCMWWRLGRAEFDAGRAGANRRGLRAYVRSGRVPGLLAYLGGEPVGWVAVEPRAAFSRLARSRNLAPADDRPVWSLTCFFVAREHRGRGLTRALIEAAVDHARRAGAPALEAYPVELAGPVADDEVYTGATSTFRAMGFRAVARRGGRRVMMRRRLKGKG